MSGRAKPSQLARASWNASTNLSDRVWQALGNNAIALEAIGMGIVNYRALSRWIIQTFRIDASEAAVLAAIRRGLHAKRVHPFEMAYKLIAQSHVHVRTGLCQVVAPLRPGVKELISAVLCKIDVARGQSLFVTESGSTLKFFVDDEKLPLLKGVLGPTVRHVRPGLAAIYWDWPEHAEDSPGSLALVTLTLALQDVNVIDGLFGETEYAFFVTHEQAQRGFQAIDNLIESARAQNKVPRSEKANA